MKISNTTLNFIKDLKKFSGDKLKHTEDISFLYEITSITKQEKLFEELIFTAKYLNGLGKILHGHSTPLMTLVTKPIEEEALDKIKTEFKDNLKKLNSQLTELLKNIAEKDKKEFETKYLSLTQESMVNLTNLIYDLSWVKKYWNKKGLSFPRNLSRT